MKRRLALDGKTWTRNSISVWSDVDKSLEEKRQKHPAMFPVALAQRVIECFSHVGDIVLDPFLGSGTTLLAAAATNRKGLGIELSPEYYALACNRLGYGVNEHRLINGSAFALEQYVEPSSVDLCFTSPPYWDILKQRRSADHREVRHYGERNEDLGSVSDYAEFVELLGQVFDKVYTTLKPGGFLVAIVMDMRKKSVFYPFHMDLTLRLKQGGFVLDDIIIWDRRRDYNSLRPLGYPYVFRINKVHEFLLILQKPAVSE
ncbi:MAG: site-specific DNA-methyltransferase [Bacillota bacterium]|nr:site-specific DNA-methyltransferase [Bacillota bacterium]